MNPAVKNFTRAFPAVAFRPGGLFRQQMQMIENQAVVSTFKDVLAMGGSITQSGLYKPGGCGDACCTHFHGRTGVFVVSE